MLCDKVWQITFKSPVIAALKIERARGPEARKLAVGPAN